MNVLAIDPGALRAGWAILGSPGDDGKATHIASGVVHHPRLPKQPFQEYRMELTGHWVEEAFDLLEEYKPDILISETVPSRGPEIMDQLYLANVQITVLHAIAMSYGVPVVQVSARSVQAKIALRKKDVKVTKPQVRNGVLLQFPELETRLKGKGKQIFEESDAIAIGLYFFGCYTPAIITTNGRSNKKDKQTDSTNSAASHSS
jgi:Holliday junction resolvasome RuvABC endonuclease subunit